MRRLIVLATPLLAFALACNGSTPGSSSTPTATPITEAQLKAMLLAAADLGPGWVQGAEESEEPSASPSGPATTPASGGPCELDVDFGAADRVAEASAAFENSETGGFLSQDVEGYRPGKADDSMAEGRSFLERCTSFEDAEAGVSFAITAWPDAPSLGDESIARKMSAQAEGNTLSGGMIVIRRGDVLTALFGISVTLPVEQYLAPAAQKAAAKLG